MGKHHILKTPGNSYEEREKYWENVITKARSYPGGVTTKSPFGKAVTYALNNWDALNRYLDYGVLTIDNNRSERALRATAVGRKKWLFMGSMDGGKNAAIISSLIASCKAHNVNPREYLTDVLSKLAVGPTELDALLPHNWQATFS